MISVRLATPEDLRDFARCDLPEWCVEWVAYVAEKDGCLIGLGTIIWDKWGRTWAAFDRRGAISPFLMHRLAKRTIAHLREVGIKSLYAECGDVPGAVKWLRRLGFRPAPVVPGASGKVWACDL